MARRLTKADIIKALAASNGVIGDAARRLGCSRQAIYKRVQSDPELERALGEARERVIDLAESKLLELVERGNITAVTFVLRTLGRSRGYAERIETEHGGGVEVRLGGVTPEELAERVRKWLAVHGRKRTSD